MTPNTSQGMLNMQQNRNRPQIMPPPGSYPPPAQAPMANNPAPQTPMPAAQGAQNPGMSPVAPTANPAGPVRGTAMPMQGQPMQGQPMQGQPMQMGGGGRPMYSGAGAPMVARRPTMPPPGFGQPVGGGQPMRMNRKPQGL